jgi:replicative DNA helicase
MSEIPVEKMRDAGAERGVIGTIMRHGRDALSEAEVFLTAQDFAIPINRILYQIFKNMDQDEQVVHFDIETVRARGRSLGFEKELEDREHIEYIELLSEAGFDVENVKSFALQIKKFSVCRQLYGRNLDTNRFLSDLTGNESMGDITSRCESIILDYISGVDETRECDSLGSDLQNRVNFLLENQPVDQVGIPTGFPTWDELIGGGCRRGTVNLIISRPKVCKSFMCLNMSRNIAQRNIPVLLLDSELTKRDQEARLLCIDSGIPLGMFENGQFQTRDEYREAALLTAQQVSSLEQFPLHYASISGMNITQVLTLIRRWIRRVVGFNEEGKANDCVVLYDYIKLSSAQNLSHATPEWILMGFMISDLHDFAIKYGIPIIAFGQTNREGIDREDSGIVAGSDRLLWLCSNLSLIKNKDRTDEQMGCGFDFGNKKLIILDCRHGSGFTNAMDYINIEASMKPGVRPNEANGRITEGLLFSTLNTAGEFRNEEAQAAATANN